VKRLATALALAMLLLPACAGSGGGSSVAGSRPATTPQTPPQSSGGNAQAALGTSVLITGSGFQPLLLVAPMGQRITWKNVSDSTQSVHLDNWGARVDSGPIPPGGDWSFNPKRLASITYHSTYDHSFRAQLQIQLPGFG
jgi:hypothetical protein